MRFRKLRIAWSMGCAILCLLLVVLWVRSYANRDMTRGVIGSNGLHLNATSLRGEIAIAFDYWSGKPHAWIFETVSNPENMVSVFPTAKGKRPLSWIGFRWLVTSSLVVIVLPNCFLASIAAALAAAPWLRWRFSLRTLLIVTTLVAILLGAVMLSIR